MIFCVAKTLLFEFQETHVFEYLTIISAVIISALEIFLWTLLSNQAKGQPKGLKGKEPKEEVSPLLGRQSPSVNSRPESVKTEYSDSDFMSAEEIEDDPLDLHVYPPPNFVCVSPFCLAFGTRLKPDSMRCGSEKRKKKEEEEEEMERRRNFKQRGYEPYFNTGPMERRGKSGSSK